VRPLAEAAIEAGLIDDETLAQFKRWGMVPKELGPKDMTPTEVVESIQDALDAEEQVRLQTTDLDLLHEYMDPERQVKGQLVLINPDTEQRGTKTTTFVIRSSRLREKKGEVEYVLRWMSDSITDMITNGRSYLRWNDGEKSRRVYMVEAEDLYFGDIKMFLVCTGMEHEDSSE
jgi:hypothetical protein